MASNSSYRLDQRVSIAGKGAGTIAFVGKTEFADGEWIGIILDEPKGKNNGTVQKKDGTSVRYFACNDNHGLYVRAAQIESILADGPTNLTRSSSNQSIKAQTTAPSPTTSGIPAKAKPTGLRAPTANAAVRPSGIDGGVDETGPTRPAPPTNEVLPPTTTTNERVSPPKEEPKQPATTPVQPKPSATATVPPPSPSIVPTESSIPTRKSNNSVSDASDATLIPSLRSKITDQEEQIQTLIKKRRDDLEKLKEFERAKIQLDQLQSYKREAQERMKELKDKLQQQENELKDTRDKFSTYRDEMADTEMRIESLALDLEMAEEKLESVTSENTTLKDKLEEVQLELDVIKGEIQLHGTSQVANGIQKKIDDERTVKLEQALIKLRDLSVTKQAENETLKKQCETLEHRVKVLMKENENAKSDLNALQATIADLKEQVDTCLGAQQMVDILTTKNLALEDQNRELQENVDDLESLCDMYREMEEHSKEGEHDLRQSIDLVQNQLREKERQIEQLQYTIGDHERTILKFRETYKTMQFQNDQSKKQMEKYEEQLKLAGSAQSSEFKAKILETKTYGEVIDNELKKIELANHYRHVQLLTLFLPEQFLKRGADHDCILIYLLIHRLIGKCDLLTNEMQKKVTRIDQLTIDDVIQSHRAEQWSFTSKLSQALAIFRMILRKYLKAFETCTPEVLRQLAGAYQDLLMHEKSIDFLIDRLQKDQLQDSVALNALDKTMTFYEHVYKTHLNDEKYSMTNYIRDFTRVVLLSNDVLQTDIQRIELLQKEHGQSGSDQSPFAILLKRLAESNEQMRVQVNKMNRLLPQEDDTTHFLVLNSDTTSSMETATRNLHRLAKTFHEICSSLTTQILMLSSANDRISAQELENIAYQACDKVYKKEDSGPYDSLWASMHEVISALNILSTSLENGTLNFTPPEPTEKHKQALNLLAEQLKKSLTESDLIRGRFERKEEELLDVKRMLKYKHDEFSELTIRLSLNEKKIESLQRESDERAAKHQQTLEEVRIDLQKKIKQCEEEIAVLHNDNEQLEDDNKKLKERLKQLTKTKLMDDLLQKKIGGTQRSTGVSSPTGDTDTNSTQRQLSSSQILEMSPASEQEVASLRNTIRLLRDELWQLKMSRTSNELSKLAMPEKETKSNEIADIYKSSTLLLNDLYSTIANYKITGENVAVKQELMRTKMKLVDRTAAELNNRLHQCQSTLLPGSAVQTTLKAFTNPQFSKSLEQTRQLAAEIHLPGVQTGGELNLTQDQYRTIMRETIGCI